MDGNLLYAHTLLTISWNPNVVGTSYNIGESAAPKTKVAGCQHQFEPLFVDQPIICPGKNTEYCTYDPSKQCAAVITISDSSFVGLTLIKVPPQK